MILHLNAFCPVKWSFINRPFYRKRCTQRNNFSATRSSGYKDLVIKPIHYQGPRELLKTIVKGGTYRLGNHNFWQRCSNAVLYLRDSFTAKDLLKIANAFAKVRQHDPVLFKEIASLSIHHESKWTIGDVPVLLDSFRACNVFDRELFQRGISFILKNIHSICPTGLSLALNSLNATKEYLPSKGTLDGLVAPIFVRLSHFSNENIATIVSALAHLDYRNDTLMKLIAHHVSGTRGYSSWCYPLLKAMIKLDYIDENVAKMATAFVYGNCHFIHIDRIPELLKILISVQTRIPINGDVYQNIIRVLYRQQDPEFWKMIFGVHFELRKINHSDTYLEELCNRIKEEIHERFSTKEKIELLRSCENYPLTLVNLFDVVLGSFQKQGTRLTTTVGPLSDSAVVSDEEHFNLMHVFTKLGYVKGVTSCLIALAHNLRNIEGALAIKYYELLTRTISYEESTEYSVKHLESARESDGLLHDYQHHVGKNNLQCLQKLQFDNEEDLYHAMAAWRCIESKYRNASLNDIALGICHADTLDFICELIPSLLGKPLIDAELVPALLRRSLMLSRSEKKHPQVLRELELHLFKQFSCNRFITDLSTPSVVALIEVLSQVNCKYSIHVIKEVNKTCIDRIDGIHENIINKRLLCNSSLQLLSLCLHNNLDANCLAACICMNSHYVSLDLIHNLLQLLVDMDFKENMYLALLQPAVEKAIMMDSDMARISGIDKCSKLLGLSLDDSVLIPDT